MAYELVYTSAERGVRPGTRGFCTVAYSRGMSPQSIQILEALSAYKGLEGVQDSDNPVSWCHLTSSLLGRGSSILSRISSASADHTGRSNKLAHHVIVSMRERVAAGPAWVSQQEGFFLEEWNGQPRILDIPKTIPDGNAGNGIATAWKNLTGNSAYAAFLPNAFLENPDGIAVLVYEPGMDILALVSEALALLEPEKRWKVTYNTYFTSLAAGTSCAWRCCIAGSEAMKEALRNPRAKVLDLSSTLPNAPEGLLADIAVNGHQETNTSNKSSDTKKKLAINEHSSMNMLNLKPRKWD